MSRIVLLGTPGLGQAFRGWQAVYERLAGSSAREAKKKSTSPDMSGLLAAHVSRSVWCQIGQDREVKKKKKNLPDERDESSQVMTLEGFPGYIGFIDGTAIPLHQKPASNGHVYFDWKRR
ncbi:hypothetical protein PPACK8108_LOCUS6502 [Phakopsora pachyrhizi]|uniref:Uncharacterized protein n=1 Tax=Phakopsora pachyrhizi TaxID=170000 RepID=A0AAV0ATV2_PHAPC|nr:hypothetical protein PPACK8108_LOCUS6502 [Phakopsora pachyrhizi]